MRITVGDIAKYGPCSKAINNSLYSSQGVKKIGFPEKMPSKESTKLGTALHEIVQHILEKSEDTRILAMEKMLNSLSQMRNECLIPIEITEILEEDFLRGSYESKMIQDLANNGITLLHNSFNLLNHLEQIYPGSNSQWKIDIEFCLHEESNNGPYEHVIFGEPTELRGYIDLVFSWKENTILGEIKSGMYNEDNLQIWERQVATYMDIFGHISPNSIVKGFIIHGGIYNGFREVKMDQTPLIFEHNDTENRLFNEGCPYCDFKSRCSEYLH